MRNKTNGFLAVGITLLALFTVFSCFFLPPDDFTKCGWYIELNIDPMSASKTINVAEYTVTELLIEVYDPEEQLIQTIHWDAEDGQQTYRIPVDDEGQYEIQVTHKGEKNGDDYEATESAVFNMQAMVITVIDIVPGFIGEINIEPEEDEPEKEDGTLTVSVTGVDAMDDTAVYMGVYEAGVDPEEDPFLLILAMGEIWLMGGAGSTTVQEPDAEADWVGTGGSFYDVYVWVDMNQNLPMGNYFPEPGTDLMLADYPFTFEVDGNVYLEFEGGDFIVVPSEPSAQEVEGLLQMMFAAQSEVAPYLTMEITAEGYIFTNPDGSWTIDQDNKVTMTEYNPASTDIFITATTESISETPTPEGFIVEVMCSMTIAGAGLAEIGGTFTIDAVQDQDTGYMASAAIAGTVIADGIEFDLAGMDLAQYWVDGVNDLFEVFWSL